MFPSIFRFFFSAKIIYFLVELHDVVGQYEAEARRENYRIICDRRWFGVEAKQNCVFEPGKKLQKRDDW